MNPADCASRGLSPKELLKNQMWWEGPMYLQKSKTDWPKYNPSKEPITLEIKKSSLTVTNSYLATETASPIQDIIEKYSSYMMMLRVLGTCFRFFDICRKNKVPHLTSNHLKKSENLIFKWVQNNSFQEEIQHLKRNEPFKKSSKLTPLYPFLDESGLLRVGGRLQNSDLEYSVKHPVILPKQHPLIDKLVRYQHYKYLHPNPSALLFIIRKSYWILGAKEIVKRIFNHCIKCIRTRPNLAKQLMGNLPQSRVTSIRPFFNVGVDYAGPVVISSRRGRGSKRIKAYICLFICLATKAIHIELATDLTSDAFIGALKRFTGRRGLPNAIYSDNATNFVGAKRKMDDFWTIITMQNNNDQVSAYLATHQIEWHTIPPSAPHFGGLWEAGIKSIKTHLRRVLGESAPTTEEMQTLLVQIEAMLNSRPLTPLNDDPDDTNILTPGHFLIGSSLLEVPDTDNKDSSVRLGERWQLLQNMSRGFWKRWHSEYLTSLQKRSKWQHQEENFKDGELVLIKDDNTSQLVWMKGRIIKTHPGTDGGVRVVSLKTSNGELKRPITKLCKLPIN